MDAHTDMAGIPLFQYTKADVFQMPDVDIVKVPFHTAVTDHLSRTRKDSGQVLNSISRPYSTYSPDKKEDRSQGDQQKRYY
jgi:hypothetical protein